MIKIIKACVGILSFIFKLTSISVIGCLSASWLMNTSFMTYDKVLELMGLLFLGWLIHTVSFNKEDCDCNKTEQNKS